VFKCRLIAAAFFSVYDTMKRTLPSTEEFASVNHMMSASAGEVVCVYHLASPHCLILLYLY